MSGCLPLPRGTIYPFCTLLDQALQNKLDLALLVTPFYVPQASSRLCKLLATLMWSVSLYVLALPSTGAPHAVPGVNLESMLYNI